MSSTQPNPDNDYQLPPAPQRAVFDRAMFNHLFGSVGSRLRAIEAQRTDLQAVIDDLRLFGLLRLDEAIVPLINQTQAQIEALQQAVADTTAANAQIIQDIQQAALQALAVLEANISEIQERVDTILAGGIPAADVAESESRVFVTPAQKADINQLREDFSQRKAAVDEVLDLKADLEDGKVPSSQLSFSTKEQAEAGLAEGAVMDPLRTANTIAALAGDVVREVFTSSGTFAKQSDDFVYLVEAWGPGAGGSKDITAGCGGGGGEYISAFIPASLLPNSISVGIGSGGNGSTASGNGQNGGTTTFGSFLSARGGKGNGDGGGGQPAQINVTILHNTAIGGYSSGAGGLNTAGGSSGMGGGGGGASGQPGGISTGGGNGGNGGANGQAPGGGGGKATTGNGGNGARGEVRITRFKRIKQ